MGWQESSERESSSTALLLNMENKPKFAGISIDIEHNFLEGLDSCEGGNDCRFLTDPIKIELSSCEQSWDLHLPHDSCGRWIKLSKISAALFKEAFLSAFERYFKER